MVTLWRFHCICWTYSHFQLQWSYCSLALSHQYESQLQPILYHFFLEQFITWRVVILQVHVLYRACGDSVACPCGMIVVDGTDSVVVDQCPDEVFSYCPGGNKTQTPKPFGIYGYLNGGQLPEGFHVRNLFGGSKIQVCFWSNYSGYFWEPHWLLMGLLEISRVSKVPLTFSGAPGNI